jgi:hypothetical protein
MVTPEKGIERGYRGTYERKGFLQQPLLLTMVRVRSNPENYHKPSGSGFVMDITSRKSLFLFLKTRWG